MDESKMKVRHLFRVQRGCEDYPTAEDLLFELVSLLEARGSLEQEFSVQTACLAWPPETGAPGSRLAELEAAGYLERRGDSYIITTNPWSARFPEENA